MQTSIPSSVDLLIVGGGINGAGLAAEAAHSGLSVVLLEKGDFASGASSKSTKLLHGGIRYLEQGRLGLVFEALHERGKLLELVPHLARPLGFLLPSYKEDRRPDWMLKIGLWLYDLLAGSRNIASHRWFSPQEALKIAPQLKAEGLIGCGLYHDAQVNDARLVLENILSAEKAGAQCFNFRRVTRIDRSLVPAQVYFQDDRSGESGKIAASVIVNASGPWANQTAAIASEKNQVHVRPTRGSHIALPEILPNYAVLVTTEGKRVLFVIPWRGLSLVGTTDLDDSGDPDQVEPTEDEISYLLKEASRLFPTVSWDRSRVLSAFAGLRPLAFAEGGHESSVSREDKIMAEGNLLTIVGGKLTTYRSMSRKAMKLVMKSLGKRFNPTPFTLPGTPTLPWKKFLEDNVPRWMKTHGLTQVQVEYLVRLYGQRTEELLELLKQDPKLKEPLHPERPELAVQVVFAVQNEKALHLQDVMLRRLEIGYSAYRWSQASEKAADWMAGLLHWNSETREKELSDYRQSLFPPVP